MEFASPLTPTAAASPDLDDEEIVSRVLAGETQVFERLMRRYNQRLYRAARALLSSDTEAEDAIQQAWLSAFRHLDQFERRASLSTWLTRIAIHEALARRRRLRAALAADAEHVTRRHPSAALDPERQAYVGELRTLLETVIDRLPIAYRCVFVLREVDGISTSETAELLQVSQGVVKTRLHRARRLLQQALHQTSPSEAFRFDGARCDRVVARVMREVDPGTTNPSAANPGAANAVTMT
jgi:RNA polymerase sigma-70 factor (ECF subfamily)